MFSTLFIFSLELKNSFISSEPSTMPWAFIFFILVAVLVLSFAIFFSYFEAIFLNLIFCLNLCRSIVWQQKLISIGWNEIVSFLTAFLILSRTLDFLALSGIDRWTHGPPELPLSSFWSSSTHGEGFICGFAFFFNSGSSGQLFSIPSVSIPIFDKTSMRLLKRDDTVVGFVRHSRKSECSLFVKHVAFTFIIWINKNFEKIQTLMNKELIRSGTHDVEVNGRCLYPHWRSSIGRDRCASTRIVFINRSPSVVLADKHRKFLRRSKTKSSSKKLPLLEVSSFTAILRSARSGAIIFFKTNGWLFIPHEGLGPDSSY